MPVSRARSFLDDYTRDFTTADFGRMFTRDTPEAYRFFTRNLDFQKLDAQPWYRRWLTYTRLIFLAFTMRLSPARRVLYAFGLLATLNGLLRLYRGFGSIDILIFPVSIGVPLPYWVPGTLSLVIAFLVVNLLMLMEVADRLSLKSDLEIARDIQLAMLPGGIHEAGDAVICGLTRPANTVGGDLYDIIRLRDGRLVLAVGDVAGKGSPAALLMALVVAMLRTLVDEGLESAKLLARLNVQVARHSPPSRFITLFCGVYDPRDGHVEYVNAGHLPPLVRRRDGRMERLQGTGLALGMFESAAYEARQAVIEPGDVLVLFSDGITEAENRAGRPFDEDGLEAIVAVRADERPDALGLAILRAVEAHAADARLGDDLTVLVLKRHN